MSRAARHAVVVALALAATPALAQWRTAPMVIWLDGARTVLAANFVGADGADLLVVDEQGGRSELRPFRRLLSPVASSFAPPYLGQSRALRAGYLAQAGSDGLADVTRIPIGGRVQVAFGDAPATLRGYSALEPQTDEAAAALHLLPRAADVLVVPDFPNDPSFARVTVLDFDPIAVPTIARSRTFDLAPVHLNFMGSQGFEAVPLRLSGIARANGLDDIALVGKGGVVLLLHQALPGTPDLAALQLSAPIEIGGNQRGAWEPPWIGARIPPWLPATIAEPGDALGVAVVDVDGDGVLDLALAQTILALDRTQPPVQGAIVWVAGTGVPAELGDPSRGVWHDLGQELGLAQPLIVRQVSVAGVPAAATWDRATQDVVVVWSENGSRRVWRGHAPGGYAADIRTVDLAGSEAPDLLVVMDNGAAPGTVLVFPDVGSPGPLLRWAAGSPGTWLRGAPHAMAVELDPAGSTSVLVEWVTGASTSAPIATGLAHTFAAICPTVATTVAVTVRGTDDAGLFAELSATLAISVLPPALSLSPRGPLVLPPGGATAVVEASAAMGCGSATLGGTPWPLAATVTDAVGDAWLRRTVAIPEAAYPALLADPAFTISLAASDPGFAATVATLTLAFDGSGLVEVTQRADRTALAPGELAVVRTRLRSRLGVPLPLVRVVDVLDGLEAAGPPSVSGARVVETSAGGAGFVLDVLPSADGEVVIDRPVRAVTGGGGSAVEVHSSGGWPLSPSARPAGLSGPPPGCGCGTGSAPGALALAVAALLVRRRGRRAT